MGKLTGGDVEQELTHIDLFSGIGGFALAARWCGLKTIQFVEMDSFCQKVLNKNFTGVPIHDDITTYSYLGQQGTQSRNNEEVCRFPQEECKSGYSSTLPWGSISGERPISIASSHPFLLTGGFPCQPYSCAGKRKGKEDDRALWPEMLRVVSEAKPRWIIGENVAGFINMGLDDCISDLENQGYEVQAFVIPACAVNAPHRRDRVWIVAHDADTGVEDLRKRENSILQNSRIVSNPISINDDNGRYDTSKISQFQKAEIRRLQIDSDASSQGLQGGEPQQPLRLSGQFGRSGSNQKPDWSENWLEVATRLCRVDDGVSKRLDETGRVSAKLKDKTSAGRVHRLKALGNSIIPQVAYEIIKAIVKTEESE